MPPTLYAATTNPGKLRDFATAASTHNIAIAPLPNLHQIPVPVEDATTFEGNARIKAIAYSLASPGLLVLADDSGLEVDALHGNPGVRSARYAADASFTPTRNPDENNNLLLLRELAATSNPDRAARYRCILALARDGEVLLTAHGAVEGRIATEPQGTGGFGYDPLFFLPELNQTMAQLTPEVRNTLSHRGRALTALLEKAETTGLLRHRA